MQCRILSAFLFVLPIQAATFAAIVAEKPFEPAFSLEQIVATRVPGQFVASPDRKSVVYTNVGRYFGHPLFPTFGEDSNLILLNLESNETVRLTSGPEATINPVFSPDGRYVSFESQDDIWSVNIDTGESKRLTTHVARDSQAAWSPDGSEIAFISSRWGQRSRLYVMDAAGERVELREVAGVDFSVRNPLWSPDGRYLLFAAGRDDEGHYSMGIYRVAARGGLPQRMTPDDNLRNSWPSFSPDGSTIAYVSDRSGFLNIWEMSPEGTDHRQITDVEQDQYYPDNSYIQSVGLRWSPDSDQILYFTNRLGNLDLMTVDVASRRTSLISDKDGSHHPVDWIDDQTIAFVYENYRTPPDLYLKRLGEDESSKQKTYSGHAIYTEDAFDQLESVHWRSEDGVEIHGYLRRPSWSTASDEPLPALVVSHTYEVGQFYNQWNPIFSYIVQSGYVLLTVNHRGSNGYGTEFRDMPRGDYGFGHVKDLASGADFLRSLPEVDPARVGILGYSMGGYLALFAVTTRPDSFKVGISVCGFSEITHERENSSTYFTWHLGGTEAEIPEAYRNASPVTHVSKITAPVQIIHSDKDTIEPVTKVRNFVYEMDKYDKPYELWLYQNETHGLKQLNNQLDSYQRVMNFLQMNLRSN